MRADWLLVGQRFLKDGIHDADENDERERQLTDPIEVHGRVKDLSHQEVHTCVQFQRGVGAVLPTSDVWLDDTIYFADNSRSLIPDGN